MARITFQGFDSIEEMFASIRAGVARAKAAATPEQHAIKDGYYFRVAHDILIYGEIWTLEQVIAREIELGADEDEAASTRMMFTESYADGFRMTRSYSVVESEGELGDVHVLNMTPITEAEFQHAKANGWSVPPHHFQEDDDEGKNPERCARCMAPRIK